MERVCPANRSIIWARGTTPLNLVLTDDHLTALAYHWPPNQVQSCLCTLDDYCPCCRTLEPRRWKAYCSCVTYGQQCYVAELTPVAVSGIMSSLPDADGFRGLFIRLQRFGEKKNASVRGCCVRRAPLTDLPAGGLVLGSLTKIYRREPPVVMLSRSMLETGSLDSGTWGPDRIGTEVGNGA